MAWGESPRVKPFLTFLAAYVLSQFYRAFLAVIAPEFSVELGLNPRTLGNLQGLWILGFVAMQFPVGWALDTIGPRRTIASTMALAVIGAGLFARAASALELDIAMALIGVGCSAIYMGAIYYFGRAYPPGRFAFFNSTLLGLGAAGNLLAASPMGWAASAMGWRAAMGVIAAATAASALSIFLLIRDPPRVASHGATGLWRGIVKVFSLRGLWPLLPITAVSYSVLLAERGLWAGPYFSQVHGLNAVERGNAILAMAAAMSIGALAYGPLDRLLGTRKWVVFAGNTATALGFLALGLFNPGVGAATALIAAIGFFGINYGVLMAHGRTFFPDPLLGRGITAMNVLFIGGAGILQPISGAYMNAMLGEPAAVAFARLHLSFGLLLLLALFVYLFAREPKAASR
jgi:predicted MFS family arabinose efflux permease